MNADRVLEVRDLSVSYVKVEAVSNANLDVGVGQIVTVIGPNGAIVEVVYSTEWPLGDVSLRLLREAGVKVRQLTSEPLVDPRPGLR